MRKAMTSLVALGIGAAAYSLTERRKKNKSNSFMNLLSNLRLDRYVNQRTWKQVRKRILK